MILVVTDLVVFFFQAEDGIRDLVRSRGLGDVYKRQGSGYVLSGGPKSEARNTKSGTDSNSQARMTQTDRRCSAVFIGSFGFRACFGFRYSCFVLALSLSLIHI